MLFLGVNNINIISTPLNYWYMIFDTTLVYKDGLYYWAEVGDWERSIDGWLGSKLIY